MMACLLRGLLSLPPPGAAGGFFQTPTREHDDWGGIPPPAQPAGPESARPSQQRGFFERIQRHREQQPSGSYAN